MNLLLLLTGFTLFLPVHGHSAPEAKGFGGPGNLELVGASWYHRWSPCAQDDARCVDAFKNDYTLPWTNERAVRAIVGRCSNGYVLFMNEPELARLSYEWQADKIHWIDEIRQELNPSCKIACCGTLTYSPQMGFAGRDWIQGLWDTYLLRYGVEIPLDVVHFHSYRFNSLHVDFARKYVQEVREVYPAGTEVWITEYGSLLTQAWAFKAIQDLEQIAPLVDRYAWFVSHDTGWNYLWLFDEQGELTELGRAYRDFGLDWPFGRY